jgi:dephospho-CoA kinase
MKQIQSMKAAADDMPYVVEYHLYDPRLPSVFEKVKLLIQSAAGPIPVEHVGSSSIPGVGGRNVLDIAIPADPAKQPEIRHVLHELGFENSPFPHYLPLLVGEVAHESANYQILLYVVAPDSSVLEGWLKFRDYMRGHPEDARTYDATKRAAIAAGRVKGDDYQRAKNPFLAAITAKLHG